MTLIGQFCKCVEFNGQTIDEILNETILRDKSTSFAITMRHHLEQLKKMENQLEED